MCVFFSYFISVEPAIQKIDTTPAPRKASAGSDNQEEGTKRKGSAGDAEEEEEEGEEGDSSHNTRYKGAKRVKLTKDDQEPSASASATPRKSGPGRPRKSTEAVSADGVKRGRGRPRKSDATTAKPPSAKDEEAAPESSSAKKPKAAARPKAPPPTDENGVPIKRGRGRPRKNVDAAPAEASPSSKGKTVFDGVILNKRRASVDETSGDAQQPAGAEQSGTAGQDDAAEEDIVLAVINGQGAVAVSSQGDSNQGLSFFFVSLFLISTFR